MCIISNFPKGTDKDTEEVYGYIRNGYYCNGEGSGYMFKRAGENTITVRKGFFSPDKLIDSIKSEKLGIGDELSVHHRIGTGGAKNDKNCHPFVISKEPSEVDAVDITTNKPCLVHNGIFRTIDALENLNPHMSDTYAFTRYIMTDPEALDLFIHDPDAFEQKFRKILGWSKITIMFPDRDMVSFGSFVCDNGYEHSNNGYKSYVYDRGGSSTKPNAKELSRPIFQQEWTAPSPKPVTTVSNLAVSKFLKFDNSTISINAHNYHHFFYCRKEVFNTGISESGLLLYTMDSFDPEAIMNVLYRNDGTDVDGRPRRKALSCLTRSIQESMYYIPKNSLYTAIYKDYFKLITSEIPKNVSNSAVKTLKTMLDQNYMKSDDDKIFYKRMGEHYTKLSLSLFKKYLEYMLYSKNEVKDEAKSEASHAVEQETHESEPEPTDIT